MFIPRVLRLKGVKETLKKSAVLAVESTGPHANSGCPDTVKDSNDVVPQHGEGQGPNFTVAEVTPEYLAQLAAGIELIFTDYAAQDPKRAQWLRKRYRVVDGEEKFVHLAAILENANIAGFRPEPTQPLLRKAIQVYGSIYLQLSNKGHHVRRVLDTYPLPSIPQVSPLLMDDHAKRFWYQCTIYVEPHVRHLCTSPGKIAQWLQEHGGLRRTWLPIQAVDTLHNCSAFVVLSSQVTETITWNKWRATERPTDWKIMTKETHEARTLEYQKLLEESRENVENAKKKPHYAYLAIRPGPPKKRKGAPDESESSDKVERNFADDSTDSTDQAGLPASGKRRCHDRSEATEEDEDEERSQSYD